MARQFVVGMYFCVSLHLKKPLFTRSSSFSVASIHQGFSFSRTGSIAVQSVDNELAVNPLDWRHEICTLSVHLVAQRRLLLICYSVLGAAAGAARCAAHRCVQSLRAALPPELRDALHPEGTSCAMRCTWRSVAAPAARCAAHGGHELRDALHVEASVEIFFFFFFWNVCDHGVNVQRSPSGSPFHAPDVEQVA